jgi:hypothetical protein
MCIYFFGFKNDGAYTVGGSMLATEWWVELAVAGLFTIYRRRMISWAILSLETIMIISSVD